MGGSISRSSFRLSLALAAAGLIASAGAARADIIVDPLTAAYDASNTDTGNAASGLINNGNLSAPLATPGTTVTYTPGSLPTDTGAGIPFRDGTASHVALAHPIFFNLNQTLGTGGSPTGYNVNGIYLYNYNFHNDFNSQRGFWQADLKYSTIAAPTTYVDFGNVNFTPASNTTTDPGAFYGLGTTLSAVANIEFANVLNNDNNPSGPNGPNGDFTGADQVRFVATPEPASFGLLGLAATMLVARRRRTA